MTLPQEQDCNRDGGNAGHWRMDARNELWFCLRDRVFAHSPPFTDVAKGMWNYLFREKPNIFPMQLTV